MPADTITLFGNFGTQNLGNEYTLKAILENLRARMPQARFNCVCPDPVDAQARYGMPAILMSYRQAKRFQSASRRGGVLRLLRRLFLRLPREVLEWFRAFRALRGTRMLVMTGTGMLGDFGIGPLDLHYEILKWSAAAKLRGAKVVFASVGAGPIADPLSRWIVKRAVSLADYRSYRDAFSKEYLARIGFDSRGDRVYPDLAFSLEPPAGARHGSGDRRVVGVGLMDYYGSRSSKERGEGVYRRYVEKLSDFVEWLLDHGYTVHLLVGDLAYDTRVRGDVRRTLHQRGARWSEEKLVDVPISSVEDLIARLAEVDLLVATRFHNLLLALMLGKPVVAVSYHEKIASLMEGVGLGGYCQHVDRLDVRRLTEQFAALERDRDGVASMVARKRDEYRRALDDQYAVLSTL